MSALDSDRVLTLAVRQSPAAQPTDFLLCLDGSYLVGQPGPATGEAGLYLISFLLPAGSELDGLQLLAADGEPGQMALLEGLWLRDVAVEDASATPDSSLSVALMPGESTALSLDALAFEGAAWEAPAGAIAGTSGDDTLEGTAGDDVLFGDAGADLMIGGAGDDTYYVDDAGDRVVEGYGAKANGFDTIVSSVDYALADGEWVETLKAGSDAGLRLTGNKGFNTLIGGAGDDVLDGGEGKDELYGGGGDDLLISGAGSAVLDGGEGRDTAVYAGAAADYSVTRLADGRVKVTGPDAYDYLSNVEALQFADGTVALDDAGAEAPVAVDDSAETQEDRAVTLDLLANDSGDGLIVTGFQATSSNGGRVSLNGDGTFTYLPAADFNGSDSFTYQVTDRSGATRSATASLVVAAVNDAPEAGADGFELTAGETLVATGLLANDSDRDGDALRVAGFDAVSAQGGSVDVAADGSFTYQPKSGFSGTDSFTYTVEDGAGGSATQTVTLQVAATAVEEPAPSAPAGAIAGTSGDDTLEGTAGDDVLFGDAGADLMIGGTGDDTYYVDDAGDRIVEGYGAKANGYDTIVSSIDYALADGEWVETLQAGSDAGLKLTGNKSYNTLIGGAGNDVLDGGGGSDSLFGGAGDDVLIAGSGSDRLDGGEGQDTAVYAGLAADYTVAHLADGRVKVTGPGAYDYLSGIETLQFDDRTVALSAEEAPAPEAPVAADDAAVTDEDRAVTLDLLANDSGDGLTVTGFEATTANGGTVTRNDDGTFTYLPAADFNGSDSFTYQVTDRSGATATATAQLSIAAVNDAPEAQDDSAEALEDTTIRIDVLANDRDPDGDDLTIVRHDATTARGGTIMVNEDGSFSYTPAADFAGTDSFTYQVKDASGAISSAKVTIAVAAVNDAPVARDDTVEGMEDSSVRIDVLGNDSDPDGDAVSVSWHQATTENGGTVVLQEDGSLLYTPPGDFNGTDNFSYRITDATGAISAAMAMILVGAVNDVPEAQADSFDVPYGQVFTTNGVLDNDSDVDGDPLSVVAFDQTSLQGGTVSVEADGSFSYLPADGFSGSDGFTYTVSDGAGGTTTQAVVLNVAAPSGAINGTSGADSLVGTAGDDVFFGGAGADVMSGGIGNDTYYVDNANDRVVEAYGAKANGFDTIVSSVDYTLGDGEWVETLKAGSDAGLRLTGNKGFNTLIGGAGTDVLIGGEGKDELYGGAGNDVLFSGAGSAILDGGEGADVAAYAGKAADYTVAYLNDGRVKVSGPDANDYLSNIEALQFADQRVELTGGATDPDAGSGGSDPSDPVTSPPPPTSPTTGVVTGPQIVKAQAPGEIVGLQLTNESGQTAAAHATTIGQAFVAGELLPGSGLVARIGDAEVPVQVDVKALHEDGSVRHAVLTFEAPAMGAGESLDVMLEQAPGQGGAAVDPLSVLQAQGHDLKLEITLSGGASPVVLDMESLLAQAQQSGTAETWLSGPQATELRFSAPINDVLEARFDVRVHADGTVRTSVTVANEWGYKEGVSAQTYDARILANGGEAYAVQGLEHYEWSNWREVVTTGGETGETSGVRVLRDVDYLSRSGAISNLDFSIGVESSSLETIGKLLTTKEFGPLDSGSIQTYMPGTGDRADIGVLPAWAVAYLQSQDARAEALLMGNAEMAGSVPWHFRDAATGDYVNLDDHPLLWLDGRGSSAKYGADAPPVVMTGRGGDFNTDLAHEPDLSFLPYLLTGDAYHLDNLQAQATADLATVAPDYRDIGSELISASNQARGQAWGMRTLANAAWVSPDDSDLKGYFDGRLQSHLDALVKQYIQDGIMDDAGEVEGWLLTTNGVKGAISPWQNHYFATVMDLVAGRGKSEAGEMLEWQSNFLSGLWLNGDNGYDPVYGAPYHAHVYDASTGNVLTADRFTTWAEVFMNSFTAEGQKGEDIVLDPDTGVTSSGSAGATGYAALARGALAGLITQGIPEASEAFGWVVERSQSVDADLARDSKFALMPEFADGSTLKLTDMHVGGAGADSQTGTAVNELFAGADGNDVIDGGGGIDLLYGGAGADIVRGGAGDDQMFGGDGADRLDGGAGNDLMKGGKGADRFEFAAGNSGHDTILDFDAAEDRIGVHGGYSLSSDGNGSTVILFDDGSSATLLGIDPEELLDQHFYAM